MVDRLSFKRFTGLEFSHRVPDCSASGGWNFKQGLAKQDNEKKLFDLFYRVAEEKNLIVNEGKMVDASFHEAPRQRNSREENQEIKEGKTPQAWKNNKHRLAHKDQQARWTKKNNETYYGYKNHVKADTESKLIDDYVVTSASVHDSQPLEQLLDQKDKGQTLHADSAYASDEIEGMVNKVVMINKIHEKGYKNKPLTEVQKESNKIKSSKRSRVEHIFAFIETNMKGTYIRTIGMARAKVNIGLTNLTYNICRAVQLGINMFTVDRCVQ